MNRAAAHPEAPRLVYRLRTALTGESLGLETAKLAWQYAIAIERANADLAAVKALFAAGDTLEAIGREQDHPRLEETAATLDFEQRSQWTERCQTFNWRAPAAVDAAALAEVRAGLAALPDAKEFLYGEYRAAIRSKDARAAYRIATLIAERYPDDANAKQEADRHKQALLLKAEQEVKDALEQLIPAEDAAAVIARYLELGLPLEESTNPLIIDALAARSAANIANATEATEAVIAQAERLAQGGDWLELERAYLACDYDLTVTGLRAKIEPGLRHRFDAVGTSLSRLRNSHEAEIALRAAIQALRAAAGPQAPKTLPDGKKAPSIAQRLEKLRSLEKQALRISGQIPTALQEELRAAYQFARRRQLPRAIALSVAAVVLAIALLFLAQFQQQRRAEQQTIQQALAALQHAESAQSVEQAASALAVWEPVIATQEPDSQLVQQAGILKDWIATQRQLAADHQRQLDQFEQLARSSDPLAHRPQLTELATAIEKAQSELAPDLAAQAAVRYRAVFAMWTNAVTQAQGERTSKLGTLQRELLTASKNAAKAKTRVEFDRIFSAASQRLSELETAMPELDEPGQSAQLLAFTVAMRADLASLEAKWSALEAEKLRLAKAVDLAGYLATLERIHSFDILPVEDKTSIEQTLRLKAQFETLLSRVVLPESAAARAALANGEADYWNEKIALDEAEQAYLARANEQSAFQSIYVSTVQYFEGSSVPQSQYSVYLAAPVSEHRSEDEAGDDSDFSFNFRVLDFDERGQPAAQPKPAQFLSPPDGSFWGFFYKPSELSPESNYYRNALEPTLRQLAEGTARSTVFDQIAALDRQPALAPAFRFYWQHTLFGLMRLNPWKWGLALSPTLAERARKQEAIAASGLNARTWLSALEQTVPSPEYDSLRDEAAFARAAAEIKAVTTLYAALLKGGFQLAGRVQPDGVAALASDVRSGDRLWSVNALTARIEPVTKDQSLTAYAPLLRFSAGERDSDIPLLLERIKILTGQDLTEPRFAPLLPKILM